MFLSRPLPPRGGVSDGAGGPALQLGRADALRGTALHGAVLWRIPRRGRCKWFGAWGEVFVGPRWIF